jgi:hypothetical protein
VNRPWSPAPTSCFSPRPHVTSLSFHRPNPPAGASPACHAALRHCNAARRRLCRCRASVVHPPGSNLKPMPCSPCSPFPPQLSIKGRPGPPRARTEPCRPPLAPPRPRSTVELAPPPSPFTNRQHHQLSHPPLPLPSPAFPSPGRWSSTATTHLRPPVRPPVGSLPPATSSPSKTTGG